MGVKPWLRAGGGPLEDLPGVFVGSREGVFRGEAVVNGGDDDVGGGGDGVEVVVVGGVVGGAYAERAAVDVYLNL